MVALAPRASAVDVAPQVRIPIKIETKSHSLVARPNVYFEDVALCDGYQPICEEILGVMIAQAPPPTKISRLNCDGLKSILTQEYDNVDFILSCPISITIQAQSRQFDKSDVLHNLNQQLDKLYDTAQKTRVSVVDVQLPYAPVSSYFNQFSFSDFDLEKSTVKMNLSSTDYESETRSLDLRLKVAIQDLLVVAASDIPASELISEKNVKLDWVDRKAYMKNASTFSDIADLSGNIANRLIRVGTVLSKNDIGRGSLIKRGEIVDMRMIDGPLVVTGKAKSLKTAGLNEDIEVLYLKTKRTLNAKVVGAKTVEVRF